MPKYTSDMVAGYVLYYTSKCVVEAMHVHASDKNMTKSKAAKIWVYDNGDTKVHTQGIVSNSDMAKIRQYIKNNYKAMYERWRKDSDNGFYQKR